MFKDGLKSPLFNTKIKQKNYHSISKIKSKRIVLPLLHDSSGGTTKFKKSLFSNKNNNYNNTTKENEIKLKKIDFDLNEFSSPKQNRKILTEKRRNSRIGIENSLKLKTKDKSNFSLMECKDNISTNSFKKRYNSHYKTNINKKSLNTESSKKNNSLTKLPLIDINMLSLNDEHKSNNPNATKSKHKFQSEKKLSLNFDFKGIDYSTQTRTGETEKGLTKENNQDASIILKNVYGLETFDIYGIMDGHGANGHLVSDFVKNKVKDFFNNKKIYKLNNKSLKESINILDEIYQKLKQNNYDLIKNFYSKTNDELNDTKFDVHFSGTTCILVFRINNKIICSNVGDSRAFIVERIFTFDQEINEIINKYSIIELSHDHKPNLKEEKERIEKLGGEVDQEYLNEEDEKSDLPFRVWKQGCDYPGLAISRCLGDKIAQEIGVISEPEIIEREINKQSKYIIMGSDGVFEYLRNEDIVETAKKYLNNDNLQKACCAVVEKSANLFKQKEDRVDDITINIINI